MVIRFWTSRCATQKWRYYSLVPSRFGQSRGKELGGFQNARRDCPRTSGAGTPLRSRRSRHLPFLARDAFSIVYSPFKISRSTPTLPSFSFVLLWPKIPVKMLISNNTPDRVLIYTKLNAKRKNCYDWQQTRDDITSIFRERFGTDPYSWQLDVTEAILLGLDSVLIVGMGSSKTMPFMMPFNLTRSGLSLFLH